MKTPRRRRIMTWLALLLSLYVVYCGLLFFFQTKLIFPAGMAGQPSQTRPTAETEVIELATDEGVTTAWFVPAPEKNGAENNTDLAKPLVVFFHGNAELIDYQHSTIDLYHSLGINVLLVEYRGYGHSEGTPSEKHIVADTLAVLEDVLKRDDVDADKLVLHGRSIGGGLATQVALQTKPAALIVESTFKSISSMAARYGAPSFIVRNPLRSEQAFQQLAVPTLIMHGKSDEIVPVSHAHALKAAASDAELVLFNAGHNDLPNGNEIALYRDEVRAALVRAAVLTE